MFSRKRPEAKIASLTKEFGLEVGESRTWLTRYLGSCSLRYKITKTDQKYYELNYMGLLDRKTNTVPFRRFVCTEDGNLCGVLRLAVDPSRSDLSDVEEAGKFQMEHGLTAPTAEENSELMGLLRQGLLDLPRGRK